MNRGSTTERRRGDGGFTLLELLIATMVAAIVLAAMNTVFYAAVHLRSSAAAAVERVIPVNRAASTLKADLRGALLTSGEMASSFESPGEVAVSGIPSLLDLYATTGVIRDDLPWGDVQRVSYYLRDPADASGGSGSGKELVRAVTRNLLATLQQDVAEQVLLSGIQSLDLSFFDGADWQSTWDSSTSASMPLAVKVQVQFAAAGPGDAARMPVEWVVPVDSQTPTNNPAASAGTNGVNRA